jgi:hypothetical protein
MSSKPNHRRGHGRIQGNGPRWESPNPEAGCNSTHVAKARKDWKRIANRAERRTGSYDGIFRLGHRERPTAEEEEDEMEEVELAELARVFPELDWMKPKDWQAVAAFADWNSWVEEFAYREGYAHDSDTALRRMLKLRENRVKVREDCRSYFGEENVPNINDPDEPTWA